MEPGRLGVFSYLDTLSSGEVAAFARKVESLGYSTLWFPETFGRDPFVTATYILSGTTRLAAATGIAVVWKRDPSAMVGAARTLAELYPGRFILGMGVSGGPFMKRHGIDYGKPLSFMREYVARMKSAPYYGPRPDEDPPIVLAALRPKMLALAAAESAGTVTALTPPEGIARMREVMGPKKLVLAQQVLMHETDGAVARAAARKFMHFYLGSPTYVEHLRAAGFSDGDLSGGGSDRLIDAMVAWGDETKLRAAIERHLKAGADQVIVGALSSAGGHRPDVRALELLAPH